MTMSPIKVGNYRGKEKCYNFLGQEEKKGDYPPIDVASKAIQKLPERVKLLLAKFAFKSAIKIVLPGSAPFIECYDSILNLKKTEDVCNILNARSLHQFKQAVNETSKDVF